MKARAATSNGVTKTCDGFYSISVKLSVFVRNKYHYLGFKATVAIKGVANAKALEGSREEGVEGLQGSADFANDSPFLINDRKRCDVIYFSYY